MYVYSAAFFVFELKVVSDTVVVFNSTCTYSNMCIMNWKIKIIYNFVKGSFFRSMNFFIMIFVNNPCTGIEMENCVVFSTLST